MARTGAQCLCGSTAQRSIENMRTLGQRARAFRERVAMARLRTSSRDRCGIDVSYPGRATEPRVTGFFWEFRNDATLTSACCGLLRIRTPISVCDCTFFCTFRVPCAAPGSGGMASGSGGMGVRLVWPLVCHHAVWCAPRSHRCRGAKWRVKWRKDKKMGAKKKTLMKWTIALRTN